MSDPNDHPKLPPDLLFYASPPHECSYLPEREAVTLFADPHRPMSRSLYTALADFGFRRSGKYVYRPRCPGCEACRPVRIPVAGFSPNRSQRRTLKRNRDLSITRVAPAFSQEHYELYLRYIRQRHPGGGMDVDDPERYMEFLACDWAESWFVEFRLGGELLAVAVIDRLGDGLSAVYTFYAPEEAGRGLGTLAVLWQLEEARRQGLNWLYLGYWIEQSPKMAYKGRFRPLEMLEHGRWRRLPEV